jgi:hypothetical protein
MTPTKSSVCLLALNEIVAHDPANRTSLVYTINSLKAFREYTLKGLDDYPSTPEGFAWSEGNTKSFNRNAVADRVSGIEKFASLNEGPRGSVQNFTRVAVLSGKRDIEGFLRNFMNLYKFNAKITAQDLFRKYLAVMVAHTIMIPMALFNTESHVHRAFILGTFLGLDFVLGADHFLQRPFYKDYQVTNSLNQILVLLNSDKQDYWALLSRNAFLKSSFVKLIKVGIRDDDIISDTITDQSRVDAPSVFERLLAQQIKDKESLSTVWAGLDFYLEKREGNEPELHIIFRSSEKRPIYPRAVKIERLTKGRAVGVLAPGLQPQ